MKAGGRFGRGEAMASDASSFLSETLADASQSTSHAGTVTHSTGSAGWTGLPEWIATIAFWIGQCQGTSLSGRCFPSQVSCDDWGYAKFSLALFFSVRQCWSYAQHSDLCISAGPSFAWFLFCISFPERILVGLYLLLQLFGASSLAWLWGLSPPINTFEWTPKLKDQLSNSIWLPARVWFK